MRLAFFDDYRLGVVTDAGIVDVSAAVRDVPAAHPQDVVNAVIANWPEYVAVLDDLAATAEAIPLTSVRLRAPLPRPVNIDCMAVNYLEETQPEPAPINAFLKSSDTVIASGETMILPDVPGTVFEAEAELAVVIGRRGQNIPEDEAMEYVFGYTNLIDGSVRGLPPATNSFYQMKSRATFCPIGPAIVTADEIPDPQRLTIRLWNNGTLMQEFSTATMAHSIARSIAFVSSVHPVGPGDVIATGTNHQGLHPIMGGDELTLEVEGLGRLRVQVRDDLDRRWERQTRGQRRQAGLKATAPQVSGKYTDR